MSTTYLTTVSWSQSVTVDALAAPPGGLTARNLMHLSIQTAPGSAIAVHASQAGAATTADQFAASGGGEIAFGQLSNPSVFLKPTVRVISNTGGAVTIHCCATYRSDES